MTLQRAHQKTFARGLKLMLVAGLVGQLLPGTVHAQGKGDNSGNPSILEAVKAVEKGVIGLQATLDALQVLVDGLDASTQGTPSWNMTLPADTRFVVLSNMSSAAVLDRETGLVWERTPKASVSTSWGDAYLTCAFSGLGGRNGWRLPTQPELASLRDPLTTAQPRLPDGHPFVAVPGSATAPGLYFWTSTHTNVSLGPFPPDSYVVTSFDQASPEFVRARVPTVSSTYVWCVRGPANHTID